MPMTRQHKPRGFNAVRHYSDAEIKRLRSLYHYNPSTGDIFNGKGKNVCCFKNGYKCCVTVLGHIYAHRLAWILFYGKNPTKTIDHINRIKTDNRIANLRLATMKEQCANQRARRRFLRTGFHGISKVCGENIFFTSYCHVGHDFPSMTAAIEFRIKHKLKV